MAQKKLKIKRTPRFISFNRVGIANLLTISIVNKSAALSAIKILVSKSLLFAGLLLCFCTIYQYCQFAKNHWNPSELIQATQKISLGDFNFKVKLKSNDEIGSLANSFNLMSKEDKAAHE